MLIYKPARQFMTPNNEPIDPAKENEFSLTVDGQICKAYRFTVYDLENNLVEAASTDKLVLEEPLYDGDILTHLVPEDIFAAGSTYKWQMDLYAEAKSFTATPAVNAFAVSDISASGDYVTVGGDPASVLTEDGMKVSFLSDADADSWPTGITANTSYYVKKYSSSATNQFYLYTDKDSAVSGGTTNRVDLDGTIPEEGMTMVYGKYGSEFICANHNFSTGDSVFVEGENLPEELKPFTAYYVRKTGADSIKLYEYLEGAKNDAGSVCLTDGAETYALTLSNVATSEQVAIWAYDVPVFRLQSETITTQEHIFVPEYIHPQDVMINNWMATIRTDGSADSDSSGTIYRSKIEFDYDGLMSGTTYYVRIDAETNVGQKITTGYVPFPVEYEIPEIDIEPTAENDEHNACMKVNWGGLVNIVGKISGTYEYVEPFVYEGNVGLQLDAGSMLTFSGLNVEEGSMPPRFWWSPNGDSFETGEVIMRARNTTTGDVLEIGYKQGAFYKKVNNVEVYNAAMQISSNLVYLIGMEDDNLVTLVVGERTPESDAEEGRLMF